MSDDEAFVREVVASPGDDGPRLVYADWLDERADPRGAFLRAEAAWARIDRAAAPPAATALDPVWVARVARPPLGVCCDRVGFGQPGIASGPPLTAADLDAFEAENGVSLPAAYRAFLLNRNGGYPYPWELPDPDGGLISLSAFYLLPPPGWDVEDHFDEPLPPAVSGPNDSTDLGPLLWVAGIGDDVGGLVLALDGPNRGRLFSHPDLVHAGLEETPFRPAADSLPELFTRIVCTDPDWLQRIVGDDLPGLAAWLDVGGDPNAVSEKDPDWHPLAHAVQWQRPALVKLLLGRGATVTALVWEMTERVGDPEITAAVRAVCPKRPKGRWR